MEEELLGTLWQLGMEEEIDMEKVEEIEERVNKLARRLDSVIEAFNNLVRKFNDLVDKHNKAASMTIELRRELETLKKMV